jgi:hypothetical protein
VDVDAGDESGAIVGGGLRLLPDGLPASSWTLASSTTLAHGAIAVHYRRRG